MNQQENKLTDEEGRSRRENIRIYNVPEGAEGSSMVDFVKSLLQEALEIPPPRSSALKERTGRSYRGPPETGRTSRVNNYQVSPILN